MVLLVSLLAAALLGFGFVLQQHVAEQAPSKDVLRFRLLLDLIVQPVWLGGIASMVGGQILGGLALSMADVSRVEPLLATNVLFAFGLARVLYRSVQLNWHEWCGAILLACGVAAFIVAGDPHGGRATVGILSRSPVLLVVVGVAAALAVASTRRQGGRKALYLAGAGGLLYGIQDAFTRRVTLLMHSGISVLFTRWEPYTLIVIGILGILLAQSAFETAPLPASLPMMNAAEPVSGILIGVTVFGEHLRLGAVNLAFVAAGVLAILAGVVLVARSPTLTHRSTLAHEQRKKAADTT